jgi:hypothetical protein
MKSSVISPHLERAGGVGQHLAKTLDPSRRVNIGKRDRDVSLANASLLNGQVFSLGTFFLTLVDGEFTSPCLLGLLPIRAGLRDDFRRHHERAVCLPHHSAGN